jgi:hypothetical protein
MESSLHAVVFTIKKYCMHVVMKNGSVFPLKRTIFHLKKNCFKNLITKNLLKLKNYKKIIIKKQKILKTTKKNLL